jgi:nitrite reductase (NO-forming)/hydroxylamine reductase
MRIHPITAALAGVLFSATACSQDTVNERPPKLDAERGQASYLAQCAACHQPTGQGLPGAFPPLAGSDWLKGKPADEVIAAVLAGVTGEITVNGGKYNSVMPAMSHLGDEDIAAILSFVLTSWENGGEPVSAAQVAAVRAGKGVSSDPAQGESHPGTSQAQAAYEGAPSTLKGDAVKQVRTPGAPDMSETEFAQASEIFFQRCAGCHGVLRKGATGKPLTPDITRAKGTDYLKALINFGSPAGMPNWGTSVRIDRGEVDIMARFLQHDAAESAGMGHEGNARQLEGAGSGPSNVRPRMHYRNIENFFAVTLRDSGEVALIDGDTKEIISTLKTGYAVHISRMSHSGRYIYTIGRDAKIDLIDLWMNPPARRRDQDRPRSALGRDLEVQGIRGQVRDRRCLLAAAVRDHGWPDAGAAEDRLHPRHDRRHPGVPPGTARRGDRGQPRAPGVHRQRQGNRAHPAGRLQRHRQPQRSPRLMPRASCMTAAGTAPTATS